MSLQYDPARLSALMFGVSGLLPALRTMKQSASRRYVRSLHREWSRFRGIASIEHMHAVEWQFSPTRPLNFPTLRISAAPELIRGVLINEMFRRIIQVIKDRTSNRAKLRELQRLFRLEPDEYWGRHYNFDRRASTVVRALGLSRVNDILANTIFPLSLLYARVFRDTRVRNGAHSLRSEFPTLSENSSTRAIRRELFYGKNALTSLPLQQGAIQLYRYYCTKGRCNECDIGKRVF